jgi:thioredoxin reductase
MENKNYIEKNLVVVGAGSAGLGIGVVLSKMNMDYVILERDSVGFSFKKWPVSMRLITPSFTGNYFNMPDLNAISPDTSPAYGLDTEHPTGIEYSNYLQSVAHNYGLNVKSGVNIISVSKTDDGFYLLHTKDEIYRTKYLVWAAGEFQYPKTNSFEGSEFCIHNSQVKDWRDFEGDDFIVIGGYESGLDSAINLSELGKKVSVIESQAELGDSKSDSSYSISPYTKDRYKKSMDNVDIFTNDKVVKVEYLNSEYKLICESGVEFITKSKPILANGFETSLKLVRHLFEFEESGAIILSEDDESSISPGLFLAGPQVRHNKVIFCFIYKFRQRFAIVCEKLASYLGVSESEEVLETVKEYEKRNFYLKDLSCCENECDC